MRSSKKCLCAAMQAAAEVIGDSGDCLVVDAAEQVIGSGTWRFVPGEGFAFDATTQYQSINARVILHGKDGEFLQSSVGPVIHGCPVQGVLSLLN